MDMAFCLHLTGQHVNYEKMTLKKLRRFVAQGESTAFRVRQGGSYRLLKSNSTTVCPTG